MAPILALALGVSLGIVEPQFIRGDANASGGFENGDALAILDRVFLGIPLACNDAGDFNDDGNLTLLDATSLLNWLFQGGSPPDPPYPECGEDPTPNDFLDCNQFPPCQ